MSPATEHRRLPNARYCHRSSSEVEITVPFQRTIGGDNDVVAVQRRRKRVAAFDVDRVVTHEHVRTLVLRDDADLGAPRAGMLRRLRGFTGTRRTVEKLPLRPHFARSFVEKLRRRAELADRQGHLQGLELAKFGRRVERHPHQDRCARERELQVGKHELEIEFQGSRPDENPTEVLHEDFAL